MRELASTVAEARGRDRPERSDVVVPPVDGVVTALDEAIARDTRRLRRCSLCGAMTEHPCRVE